MCVDKLATASTPGPFQGQYEARWTTTGSPKGICYQPPIVNFPLISSYLPFESPQTSSGVTSTRNSERQISVVFSRVPQIHLCSLQALLIYWPWEEKSAGSLLSLLFLVCLFIPVPTRSILHSATRILQSAPCITGELWEPIIGHSQSLFMWRSISITQMVWFIFKTNQQGSYPSSLQKP